MPDPLAKNTTPFLDIPDFSTLVGAIHELHERCVETANRSVNRALTLRNWHIGAHIHHFELHGSDRANYGDQLLDRLAESLTNLSNCNKRQLYRYLQFYRVYPGIVDTASPQFSLPGTTHIFQSSPADNQIVGTASPHSGVSAELLLSKCTYSHLELLVSIGDSLKRAFYEVECLRGNWSVRELRRQIASLYFERSGFSKDKTLLASIAQAHAEIMEPARIIRDPYVFEFLGLRAKEAMAESDLEDALVAHLRDFLLELGHGFCLEAQQKSILIGDTRGFVDLVFYHRILKCHVLVELKIDAFRHEHLGQLNTYVEWYRRHMVSPGDNPPIGLLLCTDKDHQLVEYATAAIDNQLFVSKYQVELPSKKELEAFLLKQKHDLEEIKISSQP